MAGEALIIDDARVVRAALGRIMQKCGYRTWKAEHGEQGLEMLDAHPEISVVFLDINMPVMDGMTFLARFAERSEPRPPVIMVSTETEVHAIIKALSLGASEYVMKPFDEEIIKSKLDIVGVPCQP